MPDRVTEIQCLVTRADGPAYLRLTYHPYLVIVDGQECGRFSNLALAIEAGTDRKAQIWLYANRSVEWTVYRHDTGQRWTADMMEAAAG